MSCFAQVYRRLSPTCDYYYDIFTMDWAGFRKQESRIMPLTMIDWESESEYYNVLVLLAGPDFRLSPLKVLKKAFLIT